MKKKVLALSVAGIFGGLSSATMAQVIVDDALQFSNSGTGNILLVPYYSAQNGNATLLSIVNTDTVNGKALKVRFRGASNSDDVFDFQLYMSPADVFTATIAAGPDGGAAFNTADNSCTLPTSVNQSFVTSRVLNADPAQTLEGYVEILNMADIPPRTGTFQLYPRIKHVNGVAPCDLPTLVSPAGYNLADRLLANDYTPTFQASEDRAGVPGAWFVEPTGGLFANWTILNVPQAAAWAGTAAAVEPVPGEDTQVVWWPQTAEPVPETDVAFFTADPLLRGGAIGNTPVGPTVEAAFYDLPDLSTLYTTQLIGQPINFEVAPSYQAVQLTGALAVSSVMNEFATPQDDLAIGTDWVFALPTRRYFVAMDYEATAANRLIRNPEITAHNDGLAARYFRTGTGGNTFVNPLDPFQICVTTDGSRQWDREETTPGAATPGFVISPGIPNQPSVVAFCGEASVLNFAQTDEAPLSVLGGAISANTVTGPYNNGWTRITTTNNGLGLPVLGQSFVRASVPGAAEGTVANFGASWDHRYVRVPRSSTIITSPVTAD